MLMTMRMAPGLSVSVPCNARDECRVLLSTNSTNSRPLCSLDHVSLLHQDRLHTAVSDVSIVPFDGLTPAELECSNNRRTYTLVLLTCTYHTCNQPCDTYLVMSYVHCSFLWTFRMTPAMF